MISSCMFSSAPKMANTSATMGGARIPVRQTAARSPDAPLLGPERLDERKRAADEQDGDDDLCAGDEPARHGEQRGHRADRGRRTRRYVPATTTSPRARDRRGARIRPAGRIQVSTAATTMPPSNRTSGCGSRSGNSGGVICSTLAVRRYLETTRILMRRCGTKVNANAGRSKLFEHHATARR